MAHEKTTLEQMKALGAAVAEAEENIAEADEVLRALSAGSAANIDSLQAKLIEGGRIELVGFAQVCRAEVADNVEVEMILSERQFSGLMGWGLKHCGNLLRNGAAEATATLTPSGSALRLPQESKSDGANKA